MLYEDIESIQPKDTQNSQETAIVYSHRIFFLIFFRLISHGFYFRLSMCLHFLLLLLFVFLFLFTICILFQIVLCFYERVDALIFSLFIHPSVHPSTHLSVFVSVNPTIHAFLLCQTSSLDRALQSSQACKRRFQAKITFCRQGRVVILWQKKKEKKKGLKRYLRL